MKATGVRPELIGGPERVNTAWCCHPLSLRSRSCSFIPLLGLLSLDHPRHSPPIDQSPVDNPTMCLSDCLVWEGISTCVARGLCKPTAGWYLPGGRTSWLCLMYSCLNCDGLKYLRLGQALSLREPVVEK